MQESAKVVAKIFGIESFNKSTISRNLKEMDRIYGESRIDGPLSAEERETLSFEGLALLVPKLLDASKATAAMDGERGGAPSPVPSGSSGPSSGSGADPNQRAFAAAGSCEAVRAALRAIPRRLLEVMEKKGAAPKTRSDARKRPARQRRAGAKKERAARPFAKPHAIAQLRREFIAICRNIVMHAAAKYHSAML
jgi:hypothetical protein